MKARIPKQNNSGKIVKTSQKSSTFKIELGKPISQIDDKIKALYKELIEKYGERRKYDIIEYMQKSEFINLFSPATPPIKKRISDAVYNLGETLIIEDIEDIVENVRKNNNLTLETIVEKMQDGDFKTRVKSMMPSALSPIIEKAVNKFLKDKVEEINRQQEEKQDILLGETKTQENSQIEVQKTEGNIESDKPEYQKLEKEGNIDESEHQYTEKNENINESEYQDTKENEEIAELSEKDKAFFKKVNKFTNGFSFLATDFLVYSSGTRKKNQEKFSNLEEYIRFTTLQTKVTQAMQFLKTNETDAIKSILNASNGRLSEVDSKILTARKTVCDKRKDEIVVLDGPEL